MAEGWRRDAACLGENTDTFFPRRGDYQGITYARSFCLGCKVRDECRTDAIREEVGNLAGMSWVAGVRGGLSAKQRRELYKTTRVCPVCDVIFQRTIANQKFCGRDCRDISDRRRKNLQEAS